MGDLSTKLSTWLIFTQGDKGYYQTLVLGMGTQSPGSSAQLQENRKGFREMMMSAIGFKSGDCGAEEKGG
jgi:hypothetical protein